MNPDSGKLHEIATDLEGIERIAKGEVERVDEVGDALKRAVEGNIRRQILSTEPSAGTEVPADWPRFRIGERVGPIKGWWFELVDVDVEKQKLVIRPLEPTKATVARRKRTRCGTRRKRRRGFK